MEQARIERRTTLAVAPRSVWSRLVNRFGDWFDPDATLEARLGGRVSSGGRAGHVTTFDEGRRIGWEWSRDGDPGWTEVEISLYPLGDGTSVEVVEILYEWEQERFESMAVERIGPSGVVAVTR
jgi:hypothetical protein